MKELTAKLAKLTDAEKTWQTTTREKQDAEAALKKEKQQADKLREEHRESETQLAWARKSLAEERNGKHQLQEDLDRLLEGPRGAGSGGLSHSAMTSKLKELENDVYVLEAQRKTVLALNPSTSAFEYIGEPVVLDQAGELRRVRTVVQALRAWLARPTNDRLSALQIFEALDLRCTGEVSPTDFASALARLGVKLRDREAQLLKEVLDPRQVGWVQYRGLLRELQGVPQLEFMDKAVVKLAKVAERRDLSEAQFLSLLDPNNTTTMTLEQFTSSMARCKAPDFVFDDAEVTGLFRSVTGAEDRTVGLKLSVPELASQVFEGVRAILVDQVRVTLEKAELSVGQLFAKYDSNKDGLLEHAQL